MEELERRFAKRKKIQSATRNAVLKNVPKSIKKHTSMLTKNTINSMLQARGFKRVVPTDNVLRDLDMTLHRFNKILDNKVEMTLPEATGFATWLGVSIEELSTSPSTDTGRLAEKFGLKS